MGSHLLKMALAVLFLTVNTAFSEEGEGRKEGEQEKKKRANPELLNKLKQYDRDRNGSFSAIELKFIPAPLLRETLKIFDKNHDNTLDSEEREAISAQIERYNARLKKRDELEDLKMEALKRRGSARKTVVRNRNVKNGQNKRNNRGNKGKNRKKGRK